MFANILPLPEQVKIEDEAVLLLGVTRDNQFIRNSGFESNTCLNLWLLKKSEPKYKFIKSLTESCFGTKTFGNFKNNPSLIEGEDYWKSLSMYSSFSSYPIIEKIYQYLNEYINYDTPLSVLVAPCGSGDFIRFSPLNKHNSRTKIHAVDIQESLINFGKIRLKLTS